MQNGTVVFEGSAPPEGALVEVQVSDEPIAPDTALPNEKKPNIWDKLLALKGLASNLSEGAAKNHDHYLYGTPK
jgi:hypothetical protein